ncbi:MAG: benenodin family lasso peptide [Sphingopyxis terrae]|nr:benenodin family lasso peptide [Sphingopyxis terrae]
MQHYDDRREDDLIDLGAVEVETKGTGNIPLDVQGGLQKNGGLSDD